MKGDRVAISTDTLRQLQASEQSGRLARDLLIALVRKQPDGEVRLSKADFLATGDVVVGGDPATGDMVIRFVAPGVAAAQPAEAPLEPATPLRLVEPR